MNCLTRWPKVLDINADDSATEPRLLMAERAASELHKPIEELAINAPLVALNARVNIGRLR